MVFVERIAMAFLLHLSQFKQVKQGIMMIKYLITNEADFENLGIALLAALM
jgi:hypothetical protein